MAVRRRSPRWLWHASVPASDKLLSRKLDAAPSGAVRHFGSTWAACRKFSSSRPRCERANPAWIALDLFPSEQDEWRRHPRDAAARPALAGRGECAHA